jgi:hypothetical protein
LKRVFTPTLLGEPKALREVSTKVFVKIRLVGAHCGGRVIANRLARDEHNGSRGIIGGSVVQEWVREG